MEEDSLEMDYFDGDPPDAALLNKQECAARKIQSIFRGYNFRYKVSQKDYQNLCAKKIQRAWHHHLMRQRIQRCSEIVALKVITKAVQLYRRRKRDKAKLDALKQHEPVLQFFPTNTKPPSPKRTKPVGYAKKSDMILSMAATATASTLGKTKFIEDSKNSKSKTAKNQKGKKLNNATSQKAVTLPAPSVSVSYTSPTSEKKVPMKRKILIDLPPPWHGKDPRRLSSTAQDELMFDQKSNVAWVKAEILPMLTRNFGSQLDIRDDLIIKNQRYKNRIISKMFLSPISRNTKELKAKNPQDVAFIRDTGVYVLCSAKNTAIVDISGFSDDFIIYNDTYRYNNKSIKNGKNNKGNEDVLFDVIIDRHSGHTVGIDSYWRLHLFERGKDIISYQLNPENKIPKASKFLSFDHFGFLWVNLFPQKGPLLCIDPITLQINTQINFDNMVNIHRFMKNVIYISPLHIKDQPFGFVALFSDTFDVYLFSTDFSKYKKLHNSDLQAFPKAKQVGNRLVLWSEECTIYIYELREMLESITCSAKFKTKARPVDICGVNEPDLLIVSCDDNTVRAYLAKSSEYSMRVPEKNLTFTERQFVNRLLGPATYTKSRGAFKEMICVKFPYESVHIDAFSVTEKLTCVILGYQNGDCGSIWLMNDSQYVKASEFDNFNYFEPLQSQARAVDDYNGVIQDIMKKRHNFINFFDFLNKFDIQSNRGEMSNLFKPNTTKFRLTDLISNHSFRSQFSFIPEAPLHSFTSYDTFHFLYRSGILPNPLSTFAGFLNRFAPDDEKINLPPSDQLCNQIIPVNTKGLYNAVVDISFTADEINSIIEVIDPLTCLRGSLPKYTIFKTKEVQKQPDGNEEEVVKESTKKRWFARYEKNDLQKRLNLLTMFEDTVKHELMKRVQDNINKSFYKNLLDKMQPVISIDIHSKVNSKNEVVPTLTTQPNRNPLLDEKRHICIYEEWSKYSLFGRDKQQTVDLRAFHIPKNIFLKPEIVAHFDLVRRVSVACKFTQCEVFSVTEDITDELSQVVLTDDSKALPLSHYLTIHSYLGANSRLLLASRSILANVLTCLYQLHKCGVIMRTLSPINVLLNAQFGSIHIGNLFDCQTSSIQVPLPTPFADPSNPFLPPEYYYEPMSEYTSAFDIWQFGILLLYVITGFQPVSYGTELLKHVSKDEKTGLYPRYNFFYDWLKGCTVVQKGESVIGQRGECFISTERSGKSPSILELDSYRLLPYKNTKLNYDESRLFIEIIAACLQIDPSKRPTAEELLRTYPFNQTNQIGDILDNYMRTPNANVFVSQFFVPVLGELNETTFPFSLGIISALLFHEENNEEDIGYAFPLDSRSAERVISALFDLKFMDRIVNFILSRVEKKIQLSDVTPTVTFKDELFDSLIHFFMRFVASVEHGQGNLISHTDDIGMSLLSLYAANPYLKNPSSQLVSSRNELSRLLGSDSAPLYVYTYSKAHALVRYSMQYNSYVFNNLNRTHEHDDNYFNQFLTFSEAVFNFANAMCHSIEKQRTNAIKTMSSLWANSGGPSTVRLFIDFRVSQKVLHCFHIQGARIEAASFVNQILNAYKIKSFDPSFDILRQSVICPSLLAHSALIIRSSATNDGMKPQCLEIIRNILLSESSIDTESLVHSDVIWSIVEMLRDQQCFTLIQDAVFMAPAFYLKIIQASQFLQKTMFMNMIGFMPKMDYRIFDDNLDLKESFYVLKKMTAFFMLRYKPLTVPVENVENLSIDRCFDFIIKIINKTLKESDGVTKFVDTQIMKETRFEVKESSFIKNKNKAKELANNIMQSTILDVSNVFVDLMKSMIIYIQTTNQKVRADLFDLLKKIIMEQVPMCHTMPHPTNYLHDSFQLMLLNSFKMAKKDTLLYDFVKDFPLIWLKILRYENSLIILCSEKDLFETQLMSRYNNTRLIRLKLFKTFILDKNVDCEQLLNIVIKEMIHNTTIMKSNYSVEQTKRMRYPLRSEAIDMIKFVIDKRDVANKKANLMMSIMIANKFLEKERTLTDKNDNFHLVVTSIELLESLVHCTDLFEDLHIRQARNQLDSLKLRFIRKWNNNIIIIQNDSPLKEEIISYQQRKLSKGQNNARVSNPPNHNLRNSAQIVKKTPTKVYVKGKNGKPSSSVKIYKP